MPRRPENLPKPHHPFSPCGRGDGGHIWRSTFSLLLFTLFFHLPGCATIPTPQQRLLEAERLATEAGWRKVDIEAPPFVLSAWLPERQDSPIASEPLTIYIEGDGLAWRTGSSISPDPSPINPVGLRLALRQPGGPAAYLARPCQFRDLTNSPACEEKYWTSHRFAPEVIEAGNTAVTTLRDMVRADSVRLVGYSGGGAVAALLAARRLDVRQLITVAGNLDHSAWTDKLRLLPLSGSLNPADFPSQLAAVPQVHLVGGKDRTIGEYVSKSYLTGFPANHPPEVRLFPDFDHRCCWVEKWPEIFPAITAPITVSAP